MEDMFFEATSSFLSCNIYSIMDVMQSKLLGWNRRHLSIGGGVTFINFIFSSLPLYFFLFLYSAGQNSEEFFVSRGLNDKKICWIK